MPTMLPAAPKTLGRLSDVFVSALGAITGESNRLGFNRVTKAIVILVDGLGSENLRSAGGHAPFLNAALRDSKSINTVFPSTTAAAITSFGVGSQPSDHGVFGYSVFDRSADQVRNLLSGWNEDFDPHEFQTLPSITETALKHNVDCFTVGPGEYAGSGFTKLNMGAAKYLAARTFDERIDQTLNIVRGKGRSLTYVYFPELDSIAHSSGAGSVDWLNKLEDLDAAIRVLVAQLPSDAGLILTADHGIVDVPMENQIYLDELDLENLLAVTGDPRNSFLYFEPGADIEAKQQTLAEQLQDSCHVVTAQQLSELGWLTNAIANAGFLPDLFVIANGVTACYHRGFAKPQSLRMVGQHGGISTAELSVPLIKQGAFKS